MKAHRAHFLVIFWRRPLSSRPRRLKKNIVWPLAIHNGVSSTFQEFRSSHFHAGIDLRTMQRTGFPVLAVADGVIERLTVTQRNYGRCLLLRHADGYSSLYGHLEKFRADLEALVSAAQASRGEKYFGDLRPAQADRRAPGRGHRLQRRERRRLRPPAPGDPRRRRTGPSIP